MELQNMDLLKMQTGFMQQDKTTQGFCAALMPHLWGAMAEVSKCLIYANIDKLQETILNELAWQLHVEFYDTTLPIQKRRELVRNALRWHRLKGTTSAVIEMTNKIFDTSEVLEWFQCGGAPFTFKVKTNDTITDTDKLKQFISAINSVKNARSHLTGLEVERKSAQPLYFGGIMRKVRKTKIVIEEGG